MKGIIGLRCAWINNVTLALGSSPFSLFSFYFETLIVVEHEKVCVSETPVIYCIL
jgi:hypothetical protein